MQLGALRAADGEFVIVPEVNFIHKITVATGEIDFRLILAIKVIDLDVTAAAEGDGRAHGFNTAKVIAYKGKTGRSVARGRES